MPCCPPRADYVRLLRVTSATTSFAISPMRANLSGAHGFVMLISAAGKVVSFRMFSLRCATLNRRQAVDGNNYFLALVGLYDGKRPRTWSRIRETHNTAKHFRVGIE